MNTTLMSQELKETYIRGMILEGKRYAQISEELGVSSKTIACVVKQMRAGGTLPEKVSGKKVESRKVSDPVEGSVQVRMTLATYNKLVKDNAWLRGRLTIV